MAEVPRSGRLATLRQLLAEGRYASQAELSEALAGHGISVSQSTLSKDLVTLAAIRQRTADGSLVYALSPEEHEDAVVQRLAQLCSSCCSPCGMRAIKSWCVCLPGPHNTSRRIWIVRNSPA